LEHRAIPRADSFLRPASSETLRLTLALRFPRICVRVSEEKEKKKKERKEKLVDPVFAAADAARITVRATKKHRDDDRKRIRASRDAPLPPRGSVAKRPRARRGQFERALIPYEFAARRPFETLRRHSCFFPPYRPMFARRIPRFLAVSTRYRLVDAIDVRRAIYEERRTFLR